MSIVLVNWLYESSNQIVEQWLGERQTAADDICLSKPGLLPASLFAKIALRFAAQPSGKYALRGVHTKASKRKMKAVFQGQMKKSRDEDEALSSCFSKKCVFPLDVLYDTLIAIRTAWIALKASAPSSNCAKKAIVLHTTLLRTIMQLRKSKTPGLDDMNEMDWLSSTLQGIQYGRAVRAIALWLETDRCKTELAALVQGCTMVRLNISLPVRLITAPTSQQLNGVGDIPVSAYGTGDSPDPAALTAAINAGTRLVDTAMLYDEESKRERVEEGAEIDLTTTVIGNAVRDAVSRKLLKSPNDMFYTTKVGLDEPIGEFNPKWETAGLGELCEPELRRQAKALGTNHFSTVCIHHPSAISDHLMKTTHKALKRMQDSGFIKGIQLSNAGMDLGSIFPPELDDSDDENNVRILPGNITDPENMRQELLEMAGIGTSPVAFQHTVSMMGDGFAWYGYDNVEYSLATGMLIMAIEISSQPSTKRRMRMVAPLISHLVEDHGLASGHSMTLSWVIHRGMIPVVQSNNPKHVSQNMEAYKQPMRSDLLEILTALKWLSQPCRQRYTRDVFLIGRDLMPDSIDLEDTHVCV